MSAYQDYMELKTLFHKWCEDKVSMTSEVMCLYWSELKRLERETRCRNVDGGRCMKNCRKCKKQTQRDGAPLSLELMIEVGNLPQDTFDMEELVERMELSDTLYAAINLLSERDQLIVILFSQGYTEREIGEAIGACQKSVNNWKHAAIAKLRVYLENYR